MGKVFDAPNLEIEFVLMVGGKGESGEAFPLPHLPLVKVGSWYQEVYFCVCARRQQN